MQRIHLNRARLRPPRRAERGGEAGGQRGQCGQVRVWLSFQWDFLGRLGWMYLVFIFYVVGLALSALRLIFLSNRSISSLGHPVTK